MASPAPIDPPEGFQLDEPNAMTGLGLAKSIADRWATGGARAIGNAMSSLYHTIKTAEEGEPLTPREGLMLGPGMLLPGFGRAVGGLGVNGARIIARTDAQKLIRSMIADGKTAKEIAASVNERFAPLLDEGASVTHQQIANGKYRGTFDVGAMGGQGASPRITSDQVEQMMRDLEYENVRTVPPKKGDSLYVYGDPPGNPPRSPADTPVVRVTADGHLGRPLSGREVGNRFDTGTPDPTRRKIDERAYQNQAGDPYADPQALEGALRWRRGDLVSPDMAPRGTRELPPLEQPTPSPQEGPIHDPRQLKLLSRGLPPGFVLDSDNAMAQ